MDLIKRFLKNKAFILTILLALFLFGLGTFESLKFFAWILGIQIIITGLRLKTLSHLFNSLLIAIVCCDILLRVFAVIPFHFRAFEALNERHPTYPEMHRLKPEVCHTQKEFGDLQAMLGDYQLDSFKINTTCTDELGFRNAAGQKDKNNEIIFLGDSYMMGLGVDQSEMIGNHFEFDTYNLGFPGGIGDAITRYQIFGSQITKSETPTVILSVFEGNDLDAPFLPIKTPVTNNFIQKFITHWNSFQKRSPLKMSYHRIKYNWFDSETVNKVDSSDYGLIYKPYVNDSTTATFKLQEFLTAIEILNRLVKDDNGELIVMIIPSKQNLHLKSEIRQVIMEELAEADIKAINASNYLLDQQNSWLQMDTHLSPQGIQELANGIKQEM